MPALTRSLPCLMRADSVMWSGPGSPRETKKSLELLRINSSKLGDRTRLESFGR